MFDHRTRSRLVHLAAGASLLAVPAAALAQDPGSPPPADAVPVKTTVSVPASVSAETLKKGVPVKVTCAPACTASINFTGPIGIITQTSLEVASSVSTKLKATPSQIKALRKGSKLTVFVTAKGADGGRGIARKTLKVR